MNLRICNPGFLIKQEPVACKHIPADELAEKVLANEYQRDTRGRTRRKPKLEAQGEDCKLFHRES